MAKATYSPARSIAAHAMLIAYGRVIALFPVFVIVINSFKNAQGDLRLAAEPALRRAFSLGRL
jgi:raffinose/stachyose/melibiose transport system permease protein